MKPIEIVELIKAESPGLLGKLPDDKAARIVRAALMQLGKQLAVTDEGIVKVQGFGNFRIKNVEQDKDGEKVIVRRVAFIAAAPNAKNE